MFYSLRNRLVAIFVILSVVPILVTSGIIALQSYSTLQTDALLDQTRVAELASVEIAAFIGDKANELRLTVETYRIGSRDRDEQRSLLENLIADDAAYQELRLLDGEGQILLRAARFTSVDDATDKSTEEEFLKPVETGEVYFSQVTIQEATNEPLITVAYPIINLRSGKTDYVLVADLRFTPIWDFIASNQLGTRNDEIFVVDSEGRLTAHANSSLVLSNTQFNLPDEDGTAIGLSGNDVILAMKPIQFGDLELIVVAERSVSDAFALLGDLVRTALLTQGIMITLAIILVVVMASRIVRPIEKLSEAAASIRDGNYDVRAEATGQDELGQLATSFNSMAEQLKSLIEGLEHRVAERTRDLEIAADVSREVSRVLNMKQLLPYLVNVTRSGFNLSHVNIYLYDSETKILRLAAGSGSVGQKMMEEGKQFHLDDKGLVPLAARTIEPQIINDVQGSTEHFVNPLLPNTQSETTLPMQVGERLIGVIDLQSNEINYFSDEQLAVLTSLAGQIAVAVQNAQLFADAQEARTNAERSDQVKSAFLASMSHELRTPLNSVINFTKFVVRGVMGPVTERQEETLNKVIASGQHLLALINDVLDMSKIESGSLTLFIEDDLKPSEILETAIHNGESLLNDKPVELQQDIQLDMPSMRGDRKRITQIFLNIVSNACKFTEEGFVKVTAQLEDGELLVSVQDTGPGIAEEDSDQVFSSFKQTNTGLRQGEGTGLGMPISKSLAEAHGGKLWFESEVGKGTTFYVKLPLHYEALQVTA